MADLKKLQRELKAEGVKVSISEIKRMLAQLEQPEWNWATNEEDATT